MEIKHEDELGLLRRLVSFSRSLHAAEELDDLVRVVLEDAPAVLPMDRMTIVLRDEKTGGMRVIGAREGDRVMVQNARTTTPLNSPFASMELQVVNYGAPLYVDDAASGSGTRRIDDSVVRSIMIAPMKYAFASTSATKRTEAFGVAAIGSMRPNRYLENEKTVFKELVNLIATALGVSLDTLRQRRAAVADATINAILVKLQGRESIDDMLTVLAEELGQVLGAKRVRAVVAVDGQQTIS